MNTQKTPSPRTLVVMLTALLQACAGPVPGREAAPAVGAAPTLAEIGEATVAGIYEYPFTLSDGYWEGPPFAVGGASRPTAGLAGDVYLSGDLDGDGDEEAVVVIWESSGGSGSYSFVATFGKAGGEVVNLGTALIGDRVQISAANLVGQTIEIDVVQQGPGDGACCPSERATRRWTLREDGLHEQEAQVAGTLSLADIEGVDWHLVAFGSDEPLPGAFAATLRIDGGRVAGQAPCNRYFGSVVTGEYPGDMSIGQVGATRMYCEEPVMAHEDAFLQALSGTRRFGFHTGRLLLTCEIDGEMRSMLFERGE